MTTSLAGLSTTSAVRQFAASTAEPEFGSGPDDEVREKFQEFVAGTIFSQMFKSLRKMHGEAAYFHGGQAERIFQSQMDQQVSEDLAKKHGAAFADPLFQSFAGRRLGAKLGGEAAAAN